MTYRSIEIEKGVPRYAAVNQNTNTNTNIIYISYTSSNFILIANLINGSIEVKIPVNSHGNIVVNDVTNRVYISSSDWIYEIDSNSDFKVNWITTRGANASGSGLLTVRIPFLVCVLTISKILIENLIWYGHPIIYANVDRRAICVYTKSKEAEMWDMREDFWDLVYAKLSQIAGT